MEEILGRILDRADNKIIAAGIMGVLSFPMLVAIAFFVWQVYI